MMLKFILVRYNIWDMYSGYIDKLCDCWLCNSYIIFEQNGIIIKSNDGQNSENTARKVQYFLKVHDSEMYW